MLPSALPTELKKDFWKKYEPEAATALKVKQTGIVTKLEELDTALGACTAALFKTDGVNDPTDAETQRAKLRKDGAAQVKKLVEAANALSKRLDEVVAACKKDAKLKEHLAAAQKIDQKALAFAAKADEAMRTAEATLGKVIEQAAKAAVGGDDDKNPNFKLVRAKVLTGLKAVRAAVGRKDTPPVQFLMVIGKTEALPYLAATVGTSHRAPLLALMGDDAKGGKTVTGTLAFDANTYVFTSDGAVSGAAKKLQAGLLRLTKAKLKVKLKGPDGDDAAEGDATAVLPADEAVDVPDLDPGTPMPGVGKGLPPEANEAEKVERVETKRRDLGTKAGRLKQAMDLVVGKEKVDLVMLRKLAEEEFGRAKELDTLMKAAKDAKLPIEPPPAKVSFDDNADPGASEWVPKVCADAFRKYGWFTFKELRKSGAEVDIAGLVNQKKITDAVMWKLYQYRRREVDKLIAGLHTRFPGLLFKSAGSEDIESDLDITVASETPGDDVKAMRQFNAAIKAKFGRPPGRVFDTNLYARDYRKIEDNISKGRTGPAPTDRDMAEPQGKMAGMARIDQDVATLMKQRRFLDDATYDAMWKELLASVPPGPQQAADRKVLQQRFEEAEAVYLTTALEKVEAIFGAVAKNAAKLSEEQKQTFDRLSLQLATIKSLDNPREMQKRLPEVLDEFEAEFPDEVMDATDEIYAERMTKLREDQVQLDLLEKNPGNQSKEAIEALKARIRQAQFTNIVFANEAYVSEGAIAHVVAGIQASTPEKKKEVLEKLRPADLLQSTNEQLADFFKDMKHMEHEEKAAKTALERRRAAGEAFVHASKYLWRMLDAVAMLQEKYANDAAATKALSDPPYEMCRRAGADSPATLRDIVDLALLRLRKSSTIPGAAKAELAVEDVKNMLQVGSVAELRKLVTEFSIDFNRRVRTLQQFRDDHATDRDTEQQYFRPAQATSSS
jgi:hypothetical protein